MKISALFFILGRLFSTISANIAVHGYQSQLHQSKDDLRILRGGAGATRTAALSEHTSSSQFDANDQIWQAVASSHSLTIKECLDSIRSSESGLLQVDAMDRLQVFGFNSLPASPSKPLWKLISEQFEDTLVQVLLGVAFISSMLAAIEKDIHAVVEPFIILSILAINAGVGIYYSRSAEDSLDALKRMQPESACVLRDGVWRSDLPASNLVPGDILALRVGDKIPADCRVIKLKTITFSTDESSLTGESVTVSKTTEPVAFDSTISLKTNMVFSGTLVTNGGCIAVVTKTGVSTEIGLINAGVQAAKEDHLKTPLAEKLDRFGNDLGKIIMGICIMMWFSNIPKFSSPVFKSVFDGAIYHAKVAVALGVAAIPEGLPAVITLCLSLGVGRMARKNVIVRKLPSVETLGCTSVICTDKTGTLTTNMMVVKKLVTFQKAKHDDHEENEGNTAEIQKGCAIVERAVAGYSYEPIGAVQGMTKEELEHKTGLQQLATVCALCNDAQIEYRDGAFHRIGEPTEAALKAFVEKLGVDGMSDSHDPMMMAQQCSDYWAARFERLAVLEFNRDRKSMSVLCRPLRQNVHSTMERGNVLMVKGAAEVLAARCSRIELEDGSIVPITSTIRSALEAKCNELARRPLRCIALAYRTGPGLGSLNALRTSEEAAANELLHNSSNFIELESDMVLLGICGIKDPARPEAASAILNCRNAGIRVMMITGDSKETAVAIAREVNIFGENEDVNGHAFTGREFFDLDPNTQLQLLKTGNKVFCRTEPKDKQKLVSMLEKLGEVTAMTGDGVNDAPALQQADIGIAMGMTGTEVAKGAADMILADDNFATIVSAVEEGRNIYSNMQAFICFLISCNMGEIATVFLSSMLGLPEPLNPVHLLWVNLVTDGPPATALGFNPADPSAMQRSPRPRSEPVMSSWLLVRYIITGCYVGLSTIGAFVWWYLDKGVSFKQLSNWDQCPMWRDFSHTALAAGSEGACEIFSTMRSRPQSLSLSVLVVVEMLKALSAVSLDHSLLSVQPWQNPYLLQSVAAPLALHLAVLYVPFVAHIFGLAPLSWKEWKVVLMFSLPVLLLEELLKFIGRRVNKRSGLSNANSKRLVSQPLM